MLTWRKTLTLNKDQKREVEIKANSLMKNEAFLAAMDDIEKLYIEMWTSTEARDSEAREKLYLTIQLLKKLKAQLSKYCDDYTVNLANKRIDEARESFKTNTRNKML